MSQRLPAPVAPAGPTTASAGTGIVRLDGAGTVALVVVTAVSSLRSGSVADLANLVVSAILFLGGCLAFGVGFLRAAVRSRTEDVDIAGVVYLTGSAPPGVRRTMLGLWFGQIAVAAASVFSVRPPFGVMAPVWGVGLITLWASRHGTFPVRPRPVGPTHRSGPQ